MIPNVWMSDFLSGQDLFRMPCGKLLQVQQILLDTCKQDKLGSPQIKATHDYWYYKQMHKDRYDTQNYGRHVFYLMHSNIWWKDFLMCAVEFQHIWLLCFAFRPGLILSKKPSAVAKSEVTSWVQHRSKPLMTTTTTTDTCLVHQIEAQSNLWAVGSRYVWPVQVYNARTITCARR
jgi:hypothetical protein